FLVIKGWDKGLKNMCSGGRRELTISPALAYGKEGKCITHEMDLNDDCRLSKTEVKEYLKKEFERHGYPANDTRHEAMVEDGLISSREFTYKHDEL
uniref:peptidylprolyl isomerase n=1 Tax=Hucho hucho TaxID=62062 RepID=A0A4W5QEM9_9TELE